MAQQPTTTLKRALNLPMLIFYGVGVTVGAGIFALIGEIVKISGDNAPFAFLLAGVIAGATGISYALLSGIYPRAGGEAVYVNIALGSFFAKLVGYAATITAIISSSVIALAFGGYLGTIVPIAQPILTVGVLILLASVACLGVRESVLFAAVITLLEVGTLGVIIFFGYELIADPATLSKALTPPSSSVGISATLSAAVVAFFAFVGFEDIENMAEETINPAYVMPRAIIATLVITVALYVLIAIIAVGLPDRVALTTSSAPLATLYESVTGFSGKPISVMASIAMINGILVQIVMASRVIYGMTREELAPAFLGKLHERRQTPTRAILLVAGLIALLSLGFPLIKLAQATSLATLSVFILVNLALWRIGSMKDAHATLHKWRYWGLFGAILSGGLLTTELYQMVTSL